MSIINSLDIKGLHERFRNESVYLKNITHQTERFYYYGLHMLLKFRKFDHVNQVDEAELIDFFSWGKTEKNWSPHTMNVRYQSLNVFFKWCIQKGVISQNPLTNIPKPRLPRKAPKALKKEQAVKIYEYIQLEQLSQNYKYPMFQKRFEVAVIATYLFTGIRLTELIDLRLEHISLDEKLITIIEGKGMKDRVVPIPFELDRVLKLYLEERNKTGILSPYFFSSQRYQGKLSVSVIKRLVKKIKEGTGIDFSVHKLRHTFATMMINAKCDIYSLSKMLGHSDVKTTQIYLTAEHHKLKEQANLHPLNFL